MYCSVLEDIITAALERVRSVEFYPHIVQNIIVTIVEALHDARDMWLAM
jgi:hypothetical protein